MKEAAHPCSRRAPMLCSSWRPPCVRVMPWALDQLRAILLVCRHEHCTTSGQKTQEVPLKNARLATRPNRRNRMGHFPGPRCHVRLQWPSTNAGAVSIHLWLGPVDADLRPVHDLPFIWCPPRRLGALRNALRQGSTAWRQGHPGAGPCSGHRSSPHRHNREPPAATPHPPPPQLARPEHPCYTRHSLKGGPNDNRRPRPAD